MAATRGHNVAASNMRQDAAGSKADTGPSSLQNLKGNVGSKAMKDKKLVEEKQDIPQNGMFPDLTAVFAVEKDKSVVIRFLDDKGKVVKQFPAEEYVNMMHKFNTMIESIYSKKV